MPEWNLTYQIGDNCTQDDFYREVQILRGDPRCTSYQVTESVDLPDCILVRVGFQESMGDLSHQILQRRGSIAVPAVPAHPVFPIYGGNRLEMQIDLGRTQDGEDIPVNSQVCMDENGQIGTRGTPIGILMSHVDSNSRTARVLITPGDPLDLDFRRNQTTLQVNEYQDPIRFSRDDLEAAQVQINRRPYPLPNLDREAFRARQQQMADEDAQVFATLDAIGRGEIPLPPPPFRKDPEPRPSFKTRYQRIVDAFKER